jgi:glycosyltransferase involved in cell wall biosynthesis
MITVIVLTYNSEATLGRCLDSLTWAENVLVVDSGSSDKTVKICEEFGVSIHYREYKNYGDQLNYALTLVETEWVLIVDSDEYLSSQLADSIQQTLAASEQSAQNGYKLARLSYFMQKPIRHGGWYPDYVLRFFKK